MKFISKILAASLALALIACEDSSTIGTSIIQEEVEIIIDSTFTVTGNTVMSNRIQSRSITQLLGKLDAKGYGNLSSDVVTQFMPAGQIDTTNVSVNDIDSIKLFLQIPNGGYIGDSITPMGLKIYRLNKQLQSPIYSDFNPNGYYSENDLLGETIYTANALGFSDSIAKLQYRTIAINLPISLGHEFFNKYKENPDIYSSPTQFAQFFPGIYISNSYGSGRIMKITNSQVKLYYHKTITMDDTGKDSTYHKVGNYFAVTPEIITNNNISFSISDQLKTMIQNGDNLLVAPTGTNLEIKFPTQEIVDSYNANNGDLSVINSLTFEIPVEKIKNDYNITPPPYVLLIKKSKADEFFAKNEITDNENSFYATYNNAKNCYLFSDMRSYIINMTKKEKITTDDTEFLIIPVSVNSEGTSYYSSSVYLTDIVPYIETPVMAKLLLDKAKIKLTYSKQTIIF
ncbi:MAG: DUF4270 domain-containing protein [Bacteroidales bacterium]|nr:DUF4270 domain-containing protein [Bacteroidales bacterium]